MIVVIGGTGVIGSMVVATLRQAGREEVAASPVTGVDALTGWGLADALIGAEVLIDVSNVQVCCGMPNWEARRRDTPAAQRARRCRSIASAAAATSTTNPA